MPVARQAFAAAAAVVVVVGCTSCALCSMMCRGADVIVDRSLRCCGLPTSVHATCYSTCSVNGIVSRQRATSAANTDDVYGKDTGTLKCG
jgi:hypothetical protein